METQYNHSIKVPSQYRAAARLLKKTFEEGASLKGLIFQEKHAVSKQADGCSMCMLLEAMVGSVGVGFLSFLL